MKGAVEYGYFNFECLPQDTPITGGKTGWPELDTYFRWYGTQLVVVTGKTGHGKSLFLFNLLPSILRWQFETKGDCYKVAMWIPENEGHIHQIFKRLGVTADVQERFAVLSARPKYYTDEPMDYEEVLDRIGVNVEAGGIGFVVLDCWNELEIRKPKDENISDYVRRFLVTAKRWARQLKVCLFITVHPTKDGASKDEPSLYDAEGSAHWANKCDNGLIIQRDYVNNVCKVRSAKVREVGAGTVGSVEFKVNPQSGLFTPLSGGDYGIRPQTLGYSNFRKKAAGDYRDS